MLRLDCLINNLVLLICMHNHFLKCLRWVIEIAYNIFMKSFPYDFKISLYMSIVSEYTLILIVKVRIFSKCFIKQEWSLCMQNQLYLTFEESTNQSQRCPCFITVSSILGLLSNVPDKIA